MPHATTASPIPPFKATLGSGWQAKEILAGQRQRVDIPAHARTAHINFLQKRLEEGSLLNRPSCNPDDPIGKGTELNCIDPSNNILTNFPRLTHRDISCGSQKKKKKSIPQYQKIYFGQRTFFDRGPVGTIYFFIRNSETDASFKSQFKTHVLFQTTQ